MNTLLTSPAVLRTLEDNLAGRPVTHDARAAAVRSVRSAKRPTVRWTRTPDGDHVVDGWTIASSLGLDLAHAAVAARGAAVPLGTWATNAARNATRRAANHVEHHCPALARAMREIRITDRGAVYDPRAWHCQIELS